jgi:hypothetical protein
MPKLGPNATAFLVAFIAGAWDRKAIRIDLLLYCSSAIAAAFVEPGRGLYRVLTLHHYGDHEDHIKEVHRVLAEGDYPDGARITYEDGKQWIALFPWFEPEDENLSRQETARIIREVLNEPEAN